VASEVTPSPGGALQEWFNAYANQMIDGADFASKDLPGLLKKVFDLMEPLVLKYEKECK